LDLPENDKLRIPIETMHASGLRAAAIVQDLLTVARGVAGAKVALDLNSRIREYFNSPEYKKLTQMQSIWHHDCIISKASAGLEEWGLSGQAKAILSNLL
jgi:signal transduction histidine kinase